MEWILLTLTKNVGSVSKTSPMEYRSVWEVLGKGLEKAEVLRDYVASYPQMELMTTLLILAGDIETRAGVYETLCPQNTLAPKNNLETMVLYYIRCQSRNREIIQSNIY